MSDPVLNNVPVSADETRHLAAKIVSAHVANNNVAVADLAGLITQVYDALHSLGRPSEPVISRPEPAVPIRKSVTTEFIICLEDGKRLKMLKRHLSAAYNMTPDQYRERWGLPADYPMVAPGYAQQRSNLAKAIGLGTRRGKAPAQPPAAAAKPAKAPRGRRTAAARS